MKKTYFKYLFGAFILSLLLLSVSCFEELRPGLSAQSGSGSLFNLFGSSAKNLHVQFLDVGQGDAIYIRTPDDVDVLIDGGPNNSILNELGSVMPFWDKEIDLMILTHPHSDHVAGLVEVLRRYSVKKVLYTGVIHTTPDYLTWLQEIKKQKISLEIVDNKSEIMLGSSVKLELLYPQESFLNRRVLNLNNSSLVARLVYGQTSFLFTGDIETETEQELLDSDKTIFNSDVLKVAHHGSETSSSEEFLQVVSPDYAVIQCGKENSFNHPHGKTLFAIKNLPATVLRTDMRGRISFVSDGYNVIVQK